MATEFLSSLGNSYNLTSVVADLRVRTDKDKILVSLDCENGPNGDIETFYATTLYAIDGIVELSDVGSIVEEYFRLRSKVRDLITIRFDDISVDALFCYCEYAVTADFDFENRLLLASPAQRVHQDSYVAFAAMDRGLGTPFVIKAVGHRAVDGAIGVLSKMESRDLSKCCTWFDVPSIIRWALNGSDEEVGDDELSDVLYFSVEYAGIQKLCYIVPAPAYLTFSFRNIFNVAETIDIVGTITAKTEASRDIAVCNGILTQYDRNVTRVFTVQTEPVPASEVPLFEQFLCSYMVTLMLNGDDYPINITDFTSEPSSDNASLTTFKFSWCFAGKRPLIFDSLVNGIMPDRHNIFNDCFSQEYD